MDRQTGTGLILDLSPPIVSHFSLFVKSALNLFFSSSIFAFVRVFSTPLPFIGLAVPAGLVCPTKKHAAVVGSVTQILAFAPHYLLESLSGYRPAGSSDPLIFQALLWLAAGIVLSTTISPLACHCRGNHNLADQAGVGLICGVVIGSILPVLESRFEWTYNLFPWIIAVATFAFLLSRVKYPYRFALLFTCLASIGIAFGGLRLIGMIGYGY
ncbi:Uncharacterised protein [Corynebacterium diphtheriae]|nr:Uncharacterised protein [Corynebacterium diphtheriae]